MLFLLGVTYKREKRKGMGNLFFIAAGFTLIADIITNLL
ncbi:hypothetical protein [Fictibacillus sp. KU28468]